MSAGPRQLLESRFAQLYADIDELLAQARERTRREFAEQLNQAVRRLRQAEDPESVCQTLAESAARFADGAILFRIADGTAQSPRIAVPLQDAPALASAVESPDPLVILATPAEVSAPLVELLGHEESSRAHLFPLAIHGKGAALVYAWGTVQNPAIELLTQVAAAVWSAIPEPEPEPAPAPAPELVTIAMATAPAAPEKAAGRPASKWEELSPAEQQIHLRAQRYARVQVAEMRLTHAEKVQAGRTRRRIYEELRQPIDEARQEFHKHFFTCPSMVDYLDLELTRTLAHEDPQLLGESYPGPLV